MRAPARSTTAAAGDDPVIRGADVPHSELLFEPELVVRSSTAQVAPR